MTDLYGGTFVVLTAAGSLSPTMQRVSNHCNVVLPARHFSCCCMCVLTFTSLQIPCKGGQVHELSRIMSNTRPEV